MKRLLVGYLSKLECNRWDQLVWNSRGGTIFHKSWYLKLLGVQQVIEIYDNDKLVAGMPVLGDLDKGELYQSTISVPYSGIVFDQDYIGKSCNREQQAMLLYRQITEECIRILLQNFNSVHFSVCHDITDMVPYIQSGFFPEVRYTYIMSLEDSISTIIQTRFSSSRRKCLKTARNKGVHVIVEDQADGNFDCKKAYFWVNSSDMIKKGKKIICEAMSQGCGKCLIALDAQEKAIGGLFLIWDNNRAYTTLAYYDSSARSSGVPTMLYLEAMRYCKEYLHLNRLDFEGSVLPGVEKFYQSFGSEQTIYFNLHWSSNRNDLNLEDLYHYV